MMENPRLLLGTMEDSSIPEDLRCKRSDGKQWRCSALSMPDKTVCEKHYIQAKKRAANSALRASIKKAKRDSSDNGDIYPESKHDDPDMSRVLSPMNVGGVEYKKYKEKAGKSQRLYSLEMTGFKGSAVRECSSRYKEGHRDMMQVEDGRVQLEYNSSHLGKEVKNFTGDANGEYAGKSTDSGEGEGEGFTCHQCRRNGRANGVWCINCDRKGYCDSCISVWYADIPIEDLRKVCPACRGVCNCRVCLHGDNLIKTKIQDLTGIEKLQYLHTLLSCVLPALKQIYSEQCFEIEVEKRTNGMKADIPRADVHADEQMCCNLCRLPIYDYHRHCTHCYYDLCLTCCRDLRRASLVIDKGDHAGEKTYSDKRTLKSADVNAIDFSRLYPKWKANSDGSIPCGPEEAGGCGSAKLVLERILKINWVAKMVKNSEEMVSGCKVFDLEIDKCASCTANTSSQSNGSRESSLSQFSHRDDSSGNFLYHPVSEDLKHEGVRHFYKHWVKGEPVIVQHVFDHSLASSWDPMSIWRGIQETADDGTPETSNIVKAIDCLTQSEIDVELAQFIKGYSEGLRHEDGWPKMLSLKDWPQSNALEEFLLCQRPEFLSNLPMVEFIHPKWGLLNLAAKLPHGTMQTQAGPKIYISYGTKTELGRGDPVTNLHVNMGDQVYLLMHSAKVNIQGWQKSSIEKNKKSSIELDEKLSLRDENLPNLGLKSDDREVSSDIAVKEHSRMNKCTSGFDVMEDPVCSGTDMISTGKKGSVNSDKDSADFQQNVHAAAIWDVFRRQDVPKLNEFLRVHWQEFTTTNRLVDPISHPIYEKALYLKDKVKRKLKEEHRIEPWTIEQHVGEAVFIPAGCPFQVRNLQSTVQLGLEFLSPESLRESAKMAQEIRCLPGDHDAKLRIWEVEKMSLYAGSWAIREIHKITLDPKLSSDIKFEDRNLTAMVSETLERLTNKRSHVSCS
ncbi:lysine-specific demethylase JMJ25 [Iris pallida]|uniref:Lysine-specific demethylase JMJ25 n=1 Tax=Iris pallida TaxID=29817 RepID=A0AAX6ILC4_IRIPA|nr:lysine-specific demethylase JMJ25 [Iris pallida]